MFVFYDTETTGLNRDFDQILQFAAILTDTELNELDRFEIRCRCLPWVVPAPMALWVTGVSPEQLADPALPSFYDMMSAIRRKLEEWGTATYLGYNTMRFDEPLMQRAFWQTLHPPYITVTNGNARLDILPLVQAASHLDASVFSFPLTPKGRTGFKLDKLAPLNGFAHENAHDALADVEATVHIARLLRERVPQLWEHASTAAPKRETAKILTAGEPILVAEYFASGPSLWWGQRIDYNEAKGTSAIIARLDHDWSKSYQADDLALSKSLSGSPKPLRAIAMNKAPLVYSIGQAQKIWSMELPDFERSSSDSLERDPEFRARLLDILDAMSEPWPEPEHLEQKIFQGFPHKADQAFMDQFHRSDWVGRSKLVSKFRDLRYRQLAQRLVYDARPDLLSSDDRLRVRVAISERLHADHGDKNLWRSLPVAVSEIDVVRNTNEDTAAADLYAKWLDGLADRFPPVNKD